jgi:hypothetical protein
MSIVNKQQIKLLLSGGILLAAGLISLIGPSKTVHANNVVESFAAVDTLQPGLVVALASNSPKTVVLAPAKDPGQIYGVVIDPSDAPFTLKSQGASVYVASGGVYAVLVSTSGGAIKAGDYLSMSPTDGIAAKASKSQSTVVGRAENSFDGKTDVVTTNGHSAVGRVEVNINVQKNPMATQPASHFLTDLANSLANKSVATDRVYAAVAVFLISAGVAVTVLWSGIKSSLVSLGRNPLSRPTILSSMYKVILTGLGIFILGLAGVYLLLKV